MKTIFKFVNINIDDIDTGDTRFQITDKDHKKISYLEKSIRDIGLLNPPLLLQNKKKGYSIVSGFQRIEALMCCGIESFGARVIDSDNNRLCSQIAVSDNSFQRSLTVAEQIKSVKLLASYYTDHETNDAFYQDTCAALHIPLNKSFVLKLWRISIASDTLFNLIRHERISLDVALDVCEFTDGVQEKIALLLTDYKISLSKQKELLLFIREISARENCPVDNVLDDILATLEQWHHMNDMNARFAKVRSYLKKRRYPEMTRVFDEHESLVSSLSLPSGMKLLTPDFMEGTVFSLQLSFKTKKELDTLNMMLNRICSSPEMEMILKREYNFN